MSIIFLCPFCANKIKPVENGFTSCEKCNRMIESKPLHRMLFVAQLIKKHICNDLNNLIKKYKIPEHEAIISYTFIEENSYSLEEFEKVLKDLGIKQ